MMSGPTDVLGRRPVDVHRTDLAPGGRDRERRGRMDEHVDTPDEGEISYTKEMASASNSFAV